MSEFQPPRQDRDLAVHVARRRERPPKQVPAPLVRRIGVHQGAQMNGRVGVPAMLDQQTDQAGPGGAVAAAQLDAPAHRLDLLLDIAGRRRCANHLAPFARPRVRLGDGLEVRQGFRFPTGLLERPDQMLS